MLDIQREGALGQSLITVLKRASEENVMETLIHPELWCRQTGALVKFYNYLPIKTQEENPLEDLLSRCHFHLMAKIKPRALKRGLKPRI